MPTAGTTEVKDSLLTSLKLTFTTPVELLDDLWEKFLHFKLNYQVPHFPHKDVSSFPSEAPFWEAITFIFGNVYCSLHQQQCPVCCHPSKKEHHDWYFSNPSSNNSIRSVRRGNEEAWPAWNPSKILPWPAENVSRIEMVSPLDKNVRRYSCSELQDIGFLAVFYWDGFELLRPWRRDKRYDAWRAALVFFQGVCRNIM